MDSLIISLHGNVNNSKFIKKNPPESRPAPPQSIISISINDNRRLLLSLYCFFNNYVPKITRIQSPRLEARVQKIVNFSYACYSVFTAYGSIVAEASTKYGK